MMELSFDLHDPVSTSGYYTIKLLALDSISGTGDIYFASNNIEFENVNPEQSTNIGLLKDDSFNGETLKIRLFIDVYWFQTGYSKLRTVVNSLSKAGYDYSLSHLIYRRVSGDPFAQPVQSIVM